MVATSKVPTSLKVQPFKTQQGQHIAITGMTGSGKSALARALLASRSYLLILRTKPDSIRYETDKVARTESAALAAMSDQRYGRIEVVPEYEAQSETMEAVMDKAYKQGGWTIFVDEGFELRRLGLQKFHEKLLTQGRSKGISVVTGVQRPSYVSRFTFSESSHVLSFRHEGRDVKVMKDAYGETHANAVAGLDKKKYEFAWTDVANGTWVGNLQALQRGPRGARARGDVGTTGPSEEGAEDAAGVRSNHDGVRE
jgi:hypothetical protein